MWHVNQLFAGQYWQCQLLSPSAACHALADCTQILLDMHLGRSLRFLTPQRQAPRAAPPTAAAAETD